MKTKQLLLLLPIVAFCSTPGYANYFSNPRLGTNLNIGSAPNPKPADLREAFTYKETTTTYAAQPAEAPPAIAMVVEPQVQTIASPPAYLAPLPAPQAVHHFLIFFDFDKSNLTAESRQVVAEAVNAARQNGFVRMVVTGHTDTVGSFSYNQALSERRANAVRAEMIGLGMNNAEIVTIGKSFSDPLVATGPGVREPQNRRDVIDLENIPLAELD